MECGGHACPGAEGGRQDTDAGGTAEGIGSALFVVQHHHGDRLRQVRLHDTAVLQGRQLRQDTERERGHHTFLGDLHCLRGGCHQGEQETVPHRDAHHHGRVPAEDAHQEKPQGAGDRGSVESHRQPAHGGVHQVHVQDRP